MRKPEVYICTSLACGALMAGCGSESRQETSQDSGYVVPTEAIKDPSEPTVITNIPALHKLSDGAMTTARIENMKFPQSIEVFRATGNIACGADETFIERSLVIAGALQSKQPYKTIKDPDTEDEVITLIDDLSSPSKVSNDPETAIWADDVAINVFTKCSVQKIEITSHEVLDPKDVRAALLNELIAVEPAPETSAAATSIDAAATIGETATSPKDKDSDNENFISQHKLAIPIILGLGALGILIIRNIRQSKKRSDEESNRREQENREREAKRARDKAFSEAQNAQAASALSDELGRRRSEAKTIIIPPEDPEV